MIVVLLGYMGSGKTSVGERLGHILNYNFIDLDYYIIENEELSITELFQSKGEIYFRKKESHYLNELIQSRDAIVLSLGGGTPCYSNNLETLHKSNKVITFYLKVSIPNLVNRLMTQKDIRPLISHLNGQEELTEFIGKHLFERTNYYNQAQHTIDCNNKSVEEITEIIVSQLI